MTTTNNTMETVMGTVLETILYIPDYILPGDENTIIEFFNNFEIAKVEKVEIYQHNEPEYNAAWTDELPYIYCYAIIYIKEWYNTKLAENFYNNIIEQKAKIVYNDPDYWDVEFCDPRLYSNNEYTDIPKSIYQNIDDVEKSVVFLQDKYTQHCNFNKNLPSSNLLNSNKLENEYQEDYQDTQDNKHYDEDRKIDEQQQLIKPNKYKKTYYTRSKSKTMRYMQNKIKKEEETIEIVKTKDKYVKKNKRKSIKNCWDGRLRKSVKY